MNREKALTVLKMARRIGVVRTDRLGDVLLTLPLCAALRRLCPDASIELITRRYVRDIVEHVDVLDAVHYIDDNSLDFILQEHLFDALFFPRPTLSEAWSALRAGVPLRVGSAFRWYSPLFSFRIHEHRKVATRHEAEYNVRMADALSNDPCPVGLVRPDIDEASTEELQRVLRTHGLEAQVPYIVIHPGSGLSAREWSPESFGKAAALVARQAGLRVIITGTQEEMGKCQRAQQCCPNSINLCTLLSLAQLTALLSQSRLLIANSTGVLHLAAAVGCPIVGLYPNTPSMSAARWGPYTRRSRVLSPPDATNAERMDFMDDISLDSVVRAALDLLQTESADRNNSLN